MIRFVSAWFAMLGICLGMTSLSVSLVMAGENAPLSIETHLLAKRDLMPSLLLQGSDARWQLQISQQGSMGPEDVTRDVSYQIEPADVAQVDRDGLLRPLKNGKATLRALHEGRMTDPVEIEVTAFDDQRPVNFPNQVVPIFTKYSCNSGGCHGKLAGQNGFRLSLLGFEPTEDYEHLVKESRGRRLFPGAPDQSLLLLKAVNASPHGGGQKIEVDSHEYRLLRRWIQQAMPYGEATDPTLVGIELHPQERIMHRNSQQQLSVVARYSDGSVENITRTVQFESNNMEMADVTSTGLVKTRDMAGVVSIMARYQGKVAVFRASIPLGASIDTWPEPKNGIDNAVLAKLKGLGIPVSPLSDDATFLRRVTLDLAGRLPTVEEARSFIADKSADKRAQWIDRLLQSESYADYFASKWNAILRNRKSSPESQYGSMAFHEWIRQSLYDNKPYDRFVKEIVTASGSIESHPPVVWYREVNNLESRVEDAAQLFLGQRVQCARCHHHPFEKWSQADYYQLAAFFTTMEKKEGRSNQDPVFVAKVADPSAPHPKSGQSLKPAGLDGPTLSIPSSDDPRRAFADWMVQPNNPFFAKSLVNRYWKHFFGIGLIEPEDDLRITNPASNPELLEFLEKSFVESGYDLKALIRLICNSYTYQVASDADEWNRSDSNGYSRFYPKRLQAEVLLDAIDTVCGSQTAFDGMPQGTRAISLPNTAFNSYFLTVFGRPESATACECERTQSANLAQSLHLLNSKEIQTKLSAERGRAARWMSETPSNDADRIRELYMVAFSREPEPKEMESAMGYLDRKRSQIKEAYEDLVWAIINSKEFLFNH